MTTIVALATPPGIGALHVIRISGPEAFRIVNDISIDVVEKTKDRIQITYLKSRNNQLLDQVVLSKFSSPYSYTGEDCIEISCHGNGLISKLIIDELVKHGCVYASRGEFTKRAFLNGKIDLNQAMNIGALFKATNEVDIYSSVQEIKGATSKIINDVIERLLNLISECELNIDYPSEIDKEDDNFLERARIKIKDLYSELEKLLYKSKTRRLSSYRVVFVGKPNAGKSSLINYLIEKDRVLVSNEAGTTRDSVEIDFCFENYLLTLVDTAGLEGEKDFDMYAFAKKSQEEIRNADLIVRLIACDDKDQNEDFFSNQLINKPTITIFTKKDLAKEEIFTPSISTKNKDIDDFLILLRGHLLDNYSTVGLKSQESINFLSNACRSLENSLVEGLSVDLVVEHLHFSHDYLCNIVKVHKNNEDKINHMFDSFCVGK